MIMPLQTPDIRMHRKMVTFWSQNPKFDLHNVA